MSRLAPSPETAESADFANIGTPLSPPPEGFFVPEWLGRYTTTVVDIRPDTSRPREDSDFGYFENYIFTISDGTQYRVREGHPRVQRSEIMMDGKTMWLTKPDGVCGALDEGLVKLGFRTRRIGHEIMPLPKDLHPLDAIRETIGRGWTVDLGYTAHNNAEIMDAADRDISGGIVPGVSFRSGASHESMMEPAVNLLGRARPVTRFTVHSDEVDACMPNPISIENPEEALLALYHEGKAIGRALLQILTSADRAKYIGKRDSRLAFWIPMLTGVHGLVSGQAGLAAQVRPRDSRMYLQQMDDSIGNGHTHQGSFEDIYADQPLVYLKPRAGAHIDIMRTLKGIWRRHGIMIDQLQQNGDNPFEIDWEQVYELPRRKRGGGLLRAVQRWQPRKAA